MIQTGSRMGLRASKKESCWQTKIREMQEEQILAEQEEGFLTKQGEKYLAEQVEGFLTKQAELILILGRISYSGFQPKKSGCGGQVLEDSKG